MNPPSWLPGSVTVGTAAAVWAYVRQIQNGRLTRAIEINFQLEGDFFGPAKKQQRVKAARGLLAGNSLEAEPILDFFETMALLLRRGALDKEIVWHTFFYWIDHYYEATREMIVARQRGDPLVWKDFVSFVATMRAFQATQWGGNGSSVPDAGEVARFLNEELTEAA